MPVMPHRRVSGTAPWTTVLLMFVVTIMVAVALSSCTPTIA